METLIRKVVPSEINDMKVEIEEFIELYNNKECECKVSCRWIDRTD